MWLRNPTATLRIFIDLVHCQAGDAASNHGKNDHATLLEFFVGIGETAPAADDGQAGKIQCGIFALASIVQCQTRQFDGIMAFDMAQSGGIPLTQNERIITHLGATS